MQCNTHATHAICIPHACQHKCHIHTYTHGTYIAHSWRIHGACRMHATYMPHTNHMHTTHTPHACRIHATCMPHTCHMHAAYIPHTCRNVGVGHSVAAALAFEARQCQRSLLQWMSSERLLHTCNAHALCMPAPYMQHACSARVRSTEEQAAEERGAVDVEREAAA